MRRSSPLTDKMAGQSHVDQAGDHHGDTEHPSGGQEREGEEVPHHLRGYEACGNSQTGVSTKHLRAEESGGSQRTKRWLWKRWTTFFSCVCEEDNMARNGMRDSARDSED